MVYDDLNFEIRKWTDESRIETEQIGAVKVKYHRLWNRIELLARQLPGYMWRGIREEINMLEGREPPPATLELDNAERMVITPMGYEVPLYLVEKTMLPPVLPRIRPHYLAPSRTRSREKTRDEMVEEASSSLLGGDRHEHWGARHRRYAVGYIRRAQP
jgi:hypothetical protein